MKKLPITQMAAAFVIAIATTILFACNLDKNLEDTPQMRQQLVERYFELVPFEKVINDAAVEMASSLPPENRLDFIQYMTKELRTDLLEKSAKQSLAKHMTVKELSAFIEFVEKPEGKSSIEKMKYYMADLMPVLQSEVIRVIEKRGAASQNSQN